MTEASIVLVLGSTGSCGRYFVEHALAAGRRVRVLVRRPEAITADAFPWATHPALEIVRGDLADPATVARACESVAAVVCLAGPPKGAKVSPMPDAVRNTVAGMRAHGVRRLIVQTGAFVKLHGEKAGLFERGAKAVFGLAMRETATLEGNDLVAAFLEGECADLDWTLARPGMLEEGPSKGAVGPAFEYGPGMPSDHPRKTDRARWYVALLDDARSHRKAPTVRYV